MPRFEVHIPATATASAVTLRVDAENWMAALKTGFQKLGEQGFPIHNALVDVQNDNSLHVTEASSGRVFRIRELTEEEAASATPKPYPTGYTPAPIPVDAAAQPLTPRPFARPLSHVPAGIQAAATPMSARARNTPSAIIELEAPVRAVVGAIGRVPAPPAPGPEGAKARGREVDALAEVFERVGQVHRFAKAEDGLYFLLDLAMEKIPAEAGSALLADAGSGDVRFAAARGPKAEELLKSNLRVPAGEGIVGFCAAEGVSLALSDVDRDPRHYSVVAEKVGYEVRSVLCSPMMEKGRTFGCLQLLNRLGDPVFTEHETGMLTYIAHQAALYLKAR